MAFTAAGLKCVSTSVGSGPSVFVYASTDAHGDVDAAGYFTDCRKYGMKVGDTVIVVDTDTSATTIHTLASITNGNGTINTLTNS